MVHIGSDRTDRIVISIATQHASFGHEPRLRLDVPGGSRATEQRLLDVLGRGFAAREQLMAMGPDDIAALPTTQLRHLQRLARVIYLDPAIVRSILDGRQPAHLFARSLWRGDALPLVWAEQQASLSGA